MSDAVIHYYRGPWDGRVDLMKELDANALPPHQIVTVRGMDGAGDAMQDHIYRLMSRRREGGVLQIKYVLDHGGSKVRK